MRFGAIVAAALTLAAPASAQTINPDALWKIVHGLCVPDEQQHGSPAPCTLVDLSHGEDHGYAVLKDLVGATQYLLIPTGRVEGIETPSIIAPDARNYFADAWRARRYVDDVLKRPVARDMIALAINSAHARSQEQLHIHIDCIRADVRAILHDYQSEIGPRWAPFDPLLAGERYRAMRMMGEELKANPFVLLADGMEGARDTMGDQTLVVAGATFPGGAPGFILLDDEANLMSGDRAGGEALQDHGCAVARPPSPTP